MNACSIVTMLKMLVDRNVSHINQTNVRNISFILSILYENLSEKVLKANHLLYISQI